MNAEAVTIGRTGGGAAGVSGDGAGRRLRVLMVAACPFPYRRGTPLRIEHLSRALVELGHDVTVATYHLGDRTTPLPFTVRRIKGLASYTKTKPGPSPVKLAVLDPQLGLLVRRLLREQPFDVIHAHHYEGLLAAAGPGAMAGVPVVYDAHTMLASELPTYRVPVLGPALGAIGRVLDGTLPRLATHTAAVTEDIRRILIDRHGLAAGRVSAIVNGVEIGFFASGHPSDEAGRAERIIYTGTLARYQGLDLLLQAFARVLRQRPAARLMLVTGESFAEYEPMARQLKIRDAIELVPDELDRLPQRLADSRVAALPRVHCDGIPQKLLNYMAAGLPVVAFKGSAKVVHDGVDGLVVPDEDVDAFARALLRCLDDPAEADRLGQAARALIERGFSWERAARECVTIYERLMSERHARGRVDAA